MTQISLKLFNKLPFARNDIGNLPEGGAGRKVSTRPGSALSSKVYVCAYFR